MDPENEHPLNPDDATEDVPLPGGVPPAVAGTPVTPRGRLAGHARDHALDGH